MHVELNDELLRSDLASWVYLRKECTVGTYALHQRRRDPYPLRIEEPPLYSLDVTA